MAHSSLSRLVGIGLCAVVACLGMLLPLHAFAASPIPQKIVFCTSRPDLFTPDACGQSVGEMCEGIRSRQKAWGFPPAPTTGCEAHNSQQVRVTNGNGNLDFIGYTTTLGCVGGSSLGAGGQCYCDASDYMTPNAGNTACKRDCVGYVDYQDKGVTRDFENWSLGSNPAGTRCWKGCEVNFDFKAKGYGGSEGSWYGTSPVGTGAECEAGAPGSPAAAEPANSAASAPNACRKGLCPGSINGAVTCVPCSETTQEGPKQTSPDGTVKQTSTECASGICTTTDTTTPPGGGAPQVSRTIESLGSFCARNPQASHCVGVTNNGQGGPAKGSGNGPGDGEGEESQSEFGGSCAASFTCSGDAIQCAMAKEQHRRNCALIDTPTPLSELGVLAANGEAQPIGHPGRDVSSSTFSLSSLINQDEGGLGSGCPSDVAIAYAGHSLTIPFSKACSAMQTLGQIAVACSMLAACFIVFRS